MARKEPRRNEFLTALRIRVAGPRGMKRFASLVAIPYTTYRNYEMGRNRVPFLAATAIAAATGEDPYSIMAGKATEEKAPGPPPAPPKEYTLHARGRVNLDGFKRKSGLKERIPVKVTAEEYGKGDDFIKRGNRFALYARGDSMNPLILAGDLLIFGRGKKPASGDVVCVSLGVELKVKRYFRDARRKLVFLQSENGRYAPLLFREGKPEAKKLKVEGILLSLRRAKFR